MSATPDLPAAGGLALTAGDSAATRLATRLAFLAAGFGAACWAPLIPFAKSRLAVDDATLGLLLLCLGIGSVLAMPLTGSLSARIGARPVIVVGGFGFAVLLPALALASTPVALGLALMGFGATLGSLDVAMNVHAVEVERHAMRPLMSGFHAMFSVGGFAGSAVMTALLSNHWAPVASAMVGAVVVALSIAVAWPRLLAGAQSGDVPLFVMPRGIVLLLSLLTAAIFLVEGALLDWGALLLSDAKLVEPAQGGLGYMLFSVAMTAGRLLGDRVVARVGNQAILVWGGALAVAGLIVLLTVPVTAIALAGFVLIGLGASNIVPVLFRQAGAQTAMPAGHAVAAITTVGYAGVLAGPAAIGFVAQATSLRTAFWMLAALVCLVPLLARVVARR